MSYGHDGRQDMAGVTQQMSQMGIDGGKPVLSPLLTICDDVFILILERVPATRLPRLLLTSKAIRNRVIENLGPITTGKIALQRRLLQAEAAALNFSSSDQHGTDILRTLKAYVTVLQLRWSYNSCASGPAWTRDFVECYMGSIERDSDVAKTLGGQAFLSHLIEALFSSHDLDQDIWELIQSYEHQWIVQKWRKLIDDKPVSNRGGENIESWSRRSNWITNEQLRDLYLAVRKDKNFFTYTGAHTLEEAFLEESDWEEKHEHLHKLLTRPGSKFDVPVLPSELFKYCFRSSRVVELSSIVRAAKSAPWAADTLLKPLVVAAIWEEVGICRVTEDEDWNYGTWSNERRGMTWVQ